MKLEDKEDRIAWLMIYTSILSFQHHPGNKTPMTPEECADEADVAFNAYKERHQPWPGSEH